MRSRTAGVMTTLMRNGRDRRSGKPALCHARKERVRLFGTRSADYIRASSHNGCIQRPNTWLHPNASLKCPIFPLHRRRRPYMAHSVISVRRKLCPLLSADKMLQRRECPLSAMYGRRLRCKGKIGHFSEAFGCSHVFGLFRLEDYLCRDAAVVAAGPDVIR